jgi:hypothetical protein
MFFALILFSALMSALFLPAQTAHPSGAGASPLEMRTTLGFADSDAAPRPSALREIDDPHSGARWFLFRDRNHPGGPGRLVLIGDTLPPGRSFTPANPEPAAAERRIVVRAGDRLVVEEHTARFNAWFEASALGSASAGSTLNARLKLSGKIVRVLVTSLGSATLLAPVAEVRP